MALTTKSMSSEEKLNGRVDVPYEVHRDESGRLSVHPIHDKKEEVVEAKTVKKKKSSKKEDDSSFFDLNNDGKVDGEDLKIAGRALGALGRRLRGKK